MVHLASLQLNFHLEPTKGRFLSMLLPGLQETKPQRQSERLCGTTKRVR